MDIHERDKHYAKLKQNVIKEKETPNKRILNQYIVWHDRKISKGIIEPSSALRSVQIAYTIYNEEPKIFQRDKQALKEWWKQQLNRKSKISGKALTHHSLQKLRSQTIKLLKFINFLETGEDLIYFKSNSMPIPEGSQYLILDEVPKKQKEAQRITQEQVKELIEKCNDGSIKGHQLATFISILNDTGARTSEILTLQNKDIVQEKDYLVINLRESKTRTRTIISVLAKPYIESWLRISPTRANPNGLFFANKKGNAMKYQNLRKPFLEKCKETGIMFPRNHLFHWFRHLFSSRASQWDRDLLDYWQGWSEGKSMRQRYSEFTYQHCIPLYLKMIEKEKNPMLKEGISLLDKQKEEEFETDLETIIENKVRKALMNRV